MRMAPNWPRHLSFLYLLLFLFFYCLLPNFSQVFSFCTCVHPLVFLCSPLCVELQVLLYCALVYHNPFAFYIPEDWEDMEIDGMGLGIGILV